MGSLKILDEFAFAAIYDEQYIRVGLSIYKTSAYCNNVQINYLFLSYYFVLNNRKLPKQLRTVQHVVLDVQTYTAIVHNLLTRLSSFSVMSWDNGILSGDDVVCR